MEDFDDMFVGRKNLKKEDKNNDLDKKVTTTIFGNLSDIQKLDNLVWIRIHDKYEKATRATIIEDSLQLLAEEMNYENLREQYKEKLSKADTIKGRGTKDKDSEDAEVKTSISIYTAKKNVVLLNNIVWLRKHIMFEKATRGTIINMSLELYSENINYQKLAKKYKEHLPFKLKL
jgi:hypothetical protein